MGIKVKPRLGRGLSGLLAKSVEVSSTTIVDTINVESTEPWAGPGHAGPIPIDAVTPNRFQPRRNISDDSLRTLADSIRSSGVMQPIAVRRVHSSGGAAARYELVAGERRWRAARLAGISHIPAIIVELDDQGSAEWALVENIQREDLNPIDRALAFKRLIDDFGATQSEVAARVGIDRTSVAGTLRLLDLEPELRDMVIHGTLTMGHAKALLIAPPGPDRVEAGRKAASAGWSVRATEQWSNDAARRRNPPVLRGEPAAIVGSTLARAAHVSALEKQLGEYFGTKVGIKTDAKGRKGRIAIEFYSLEHFEGLMQRMGFRMES